MRHWLATLLAITTSAALLFATPAARASNNDLPPASDLRVAGALAAKAGGPLVVIYSRHDCKYCEAVKRDYLKPLANNPKYRGKLVILQVNQDSEAAITDFHDEQTTQARFAASEKIKLVPVVAFYGPNGQRLAEPIVGARLPDFYQSYLESAIEQSMASLSRR
jgi:thioredoxin-related protein